MPSVAEQLHEGREARNLSIQQVAEITKIRTDHVRALEEGNFSVFSAPVYIRGFVRTYSTLLKLDVPHVMATLDEELGRSEKFSEPPPFAEPPHSFTDLVMLQLSKLEWRKAVVGLGVFLVLGALVFGTVAWQRYRRADPLKGLKPALYQDKAKNAGETLPLPSTPPKR